MTNAAALGGASSSCRGGAVRGGGGRQRTTSVSESPDALRQWLTVAMAPDWLSLQAAHRGLRGVFGGPKKRRAWHPSFDTVGVLALRSPPADHFASRQEERLQRPWPGCRATVVQPDGARRWDDAYPCLLPWAMEHDAGSRPASAPPQEASPGRRSLRPGCHDASPTAPAECTATPASPRCRGDAPRWVGGRRAQLPG